MTAQELRSKIRIEPKGYGHFKTTIEFRGKKYSCTTTNTLAIDKIGDTNKTPKSFYTTEKQALLSLWSECKSKNNIA